MRSNTDVSMLTPKQAESAAAALAMRPKANRGDMLACPVCGAAALSTTTRRSMGVLKRTPCPHCGALLHLKWGRALFISYLTVLIVAGAAAYIGWPADRHLVQSLAGPVLVLMFVVLAAALRRLPLAAD
jgi:hypothetical protein